MPHPAERQTPSPDPGSGDWIPGGNPWIMIGTIVGAKLATIVVIVAASWSLETGGFVLLTHWHWLPLIGALIAAPVAYAIRLRRVRAKREALRRSEWIIRELDLPASVATGPGERTVVVDTAPWRS